MKEVQWCLRRKKTLQRKKLKWVGKSFNLKALIKCRSENNEGTLNLWEQVSKMWYCGEETGAGPCTFPREE